jgi:hypothetical protein
MANVVPSSTILVTLMMEAVRSSETSVLTRAKRRNILEDGFPLLFFNVVVWKSIPIIVCGWNQGDSSIMLKTVIWSSMREGLMQDSVIIRIPNTLY